MINVEVKTGVIFEMDLELSEDKTRIEMEC